MGKNYFILEEHKSYPNIKPNKTYYQFLYFFNDYIDLLNFFTAPYQKIISIIYKKY